MRRFARAAAGRLRAAAERIREFMLEYAYLMTLGAALVVVAASALYTSQVREEAQIQAAADAPEVEQSAAPSPSPSATPVPLATMAPVHVASAIRLGGSTARPVGGERLRGFDARTPVVWEALRACKPHAALDLAGERGEDVLAAADGTVASAARDELWGWRVTVSQTDGQTAVYAGLESSFVSPGQNVTRAQALGALAESVPCEAELGAHLHMELLSGGRLCDPQTILP